MVLLPVINAASLDELDKVILGDARGDVSPSIDRKVGAPRHRQVQPYEGRLLINELCVPEIVRRYDRRVCDVVRLQFQYGRPLLRGLLDLWIALLLLRRGLRYARMLYCTRPNTLCKH